jgi:hypothetical protein
MAKMILGAVAAVLVALLAGFLWGAAGTRGLEQSLGHSALRGDLLEARGAVLASRIDIYNTNFGDSSRNLESARALVERALQRLRDLGREEDAGRLEAALPPIREAQQLAGRLDLGANGRAAEASKAIEALLQTLPAPES